MHSRKLSGTYANIFLMKPSLVIIGLGNPGREYENTRHNAGFIAIDVLSNAYGQGEWKDQQKFEAFVQEARVGVAPVLLVKPRTFMNLSGDSARKIVNFFKLNAGQQVLILCDELDLPLGTLRLREKGSAGTHNGLKSIVEQFGENFARLRIGVGPKPEKVDLAAWVLSAFTEDERKTLEGTIATLPDIVATFVMGQFPGEN